MKLYLWDWDNSGAIEVVDVPDLPWKNWEDANKQHAFSNFAQAKRVARKDLDEKLVGLRYSIDHLKKLKSTAVQPAKGFPAYA